MRGDAYDLSLVLADGISLVDRRDDRVVVALAAAVGLDLDGLTSA